MPGTASSSTSPAAPPAVAPAEPEPVAPVEWADEEAPRPLHEVLAAGGHDTPPRPPAPETPPADPFASPLYASPFFRETAPAAPLASPPPAPPSDAFPPASDAAQGWSLRRLVTGEPEPDGLPVSASEAEREKIRRLLDDLRERAAHRADPMDELRWDLGALGHDVARSS